MNTLRIFSTTLFISFAFLLTVMVGSASAATWTEVEMGTAQSLRGITGVGDQMVSVGNTGNLMYSTDSGLTWSLVDNFSNVWWLDAAVDTDGNFVAIGESGGYVESLDGGMTWDSISLGSSSRLNGVDFSDSYGYIVGEGGVGFSYSVNTSTWSSSTTNVTNNINAVYDQGDGTAWAVTDGGKLLYISSGGASWSETATISSTNLTGVAFVSATDGWVVGENGEFLATTSTGADWESVTVDGLLYQDLFDVQVSGDSIVVVGDGIVILSTDGGTTWETTDYSDEQFVFHAAFIADDGTISIAGTKFDVFSLVYQYQQEEVVEEEVEEEEEIVEEVVEEEDEPLVAEESNLIKLACAEDAGVNDACRAVYYYANDHKRHAFPNERIFLTWFDDFDDVIEVSGDFMSDISLGKNVTYHPGAKMVKFQTVPTVYAVSAVGELRAIASEDVASDLYGSDWNQQIDDIPDVFFGNYSFGDAIESSSDFDVSAEEAAVASLDENF